MTEQQTPPPLPALPDGYTMRPPRRSDAEGVVALVNATDSALGADADETLADLLAEWDDPDHDLMNGAWLIEDANGQVVGFEHCQEHANSGELDVDGYVHPQHTGRGLGTYLMRLAERRAHALIAKYPAEAEVRLIVHCYSHDQAAVALFAAEGYSVVRQFWRMVIDMAEAPAAVTFPNGISVRRFVLGQDDHATHAAVTEVFRDSWGFVPLSFDEWAATRIRREDFDPQWWLLAIDEATQEIAGFALGNLRGEAQDFGWVRALGVRRPYRKQGLGLTLLRYAFGEFYKHGLKSVGLGVDTQNITGATRLYERAGMYAKFCFDRAEKVIRNGVLLKRVNVGE